MTVKTNTYLELSDVVSRYPHVACPYCGGEFEDDDKAFALETGLCQYCHKPLDQLDAIPPREERS